jgi:hypothetical protein
MTKEAIDAFELGLIIKEPKGKTRIFDEILVSLTTEGTLVG